MATNTAGSTARDFTMQMVHYLRKTVVFGDGTVTVGTIPAGAVLLKDQSSVLVSEAFNAGTTNTLHVGTSADEDAYASALALGAIAQVGFDEFSAANVVSADTVITAKYNQSGTAPSAGSAEIVVAYIPDNDG